MSFRLMDSYPTTTLNQYTDCTYACSEYCLDIFQSINLKTALESKEKTASDLESKTKNMKADLAMKNKQIKELEKEVSHVKFYSESILISM